LLLALWVGVAKLRLLPQGWRDTLLEEVGEILYTLYRRGGRVTCALGWSVIPKPVKVRQHLSRLRGYFIVAALAVCFQLAFLLLCYHNKIYFFSQYNFIHLWGYFCGNYWVVCF